MKVGVATAAVMVAALGLKALATLLVIDLIGLGLAMLCNKRGGGGGPSGRSRGRYRGWLIRLTIEWGPRVGPASLDR